MEREDLDGSWNTPQTTVYWFKTTEQVAWVVTGVCGPDKLLRKPSTAVIRRWKIATEESPLGCSGWFFSNLLNLVNELAKDNK